jgi:hypothetical protein
MLEYFRPECEGSRAKIYYKTHVMTATEYIVMGQKKVDSPDVYNLR